MAASHYLGSLTWLEGPNKATQDSIIEQLKSALSDRNYTLGQTIDNDYSPVLSFSHSEHSDLAQAQKDWLAAYDSIQGSQRMFISDPKCEVNQEIHASGAAADAEPSQTQSIDDIPVVGPAPTPFVTQSMSLEDKKRRALELLRSEGLSWGPSGM